jgi:hypothetical protein
MSSTSLGSGLQQTLSCLDSRTFNLNLLIVSFHKQDFSGESSNFFYRAPIIMMKTICIVILSLNPAVDFSLRSPL